MSQEYSSTLSTKRIVCSLAIFFLIPAVEWFVNLWVHDATLSYTFALNLAGWALILYDWNLFGIHYNRSKYNLPDTLLYSLIGIVFIGAWTWIGESFLKCHLLLPDPASIRAYRFAEPAILLAYSYILAAIVNICFKCLTDHIDVRSKEATVILVSGFLFGFFFTLAFTSLQLELWIRTYLYNVILIAFLSYLYNQSSSFIPGIISMGTVLLIMQILAMH